MEQLGALKEVQGKKRRGIPRSALAPPELEDKQREEGGKPRTTGSLPGEAPHGHHCAITANTIP